MLDQRGVLLAEGIGGAHGLVRWYGSRKARATAEREGAGPFDLTFIDADKVHTPDYFAWALEHSRPGGLIVADNVVRDGTLADAGSDDPVVQAQRRLHEMLAVESRVSATTIQTVGAKGYDGFTIALVTCLSRRS